MASSLWHLSCISIFKHVSISLLSFAAAAPILGHQIDVIEDQSFLSLAALTSLDLSHNGVVAISGQSLSHLNEYVSSYSSSS
jgi:hypothetical protein